MPASVIENAENKHGRKQEQGLQSIETNNSESDAPVIRIPEGMVMSRATASSNSSFGTLSTHSSLTNGHTNISRPVPRQVPPSSSLPNQQRQHDSNLNMFNSEANRRNHNSNDNSNKTKQQGNILTATFAWMQKNRERRRQIQLQQEAEEQLRKIANAEGIHTNQQAIRGGGSWEKRHHISKSGEGQTAELELDLNKNVADEEEETDDEFIIPEVRIHPESCLLKDQALDDGSQSPTKTFKAPPYLLTAEQMHQIAMYVLPKTIAYCQWRRLYSLTRDGDSFDGCLRIISEVSRTLMVIRSAKGAVFGGYAELPWRPQEKGSARFYGSAQACLFSVKEPDTPLHQVENPKRLLNVFHWSGKNRYIQVCDVANKMLAFGGGGVKGSFGLCVQEDFQTGSTGPCDTFDNDALCEEGTFEVVDVEFWEFLTGVF